MTRYVRRREALATGASVVIGAMAGCFGNETDWDVAALSTADGSKQWTTGLESGGIAGGLALSDGTLYALGDFGVWALATADGSEQWHFEPESYWDVSGAPVVAGEALYFTSNTFIQCLAVADGSERWRVEPGGDPGISAGPARVDDAVVFGFENGRVAGLEVADGTRRWDRNLGDEVTAIAGAGDAVLVGTTAHRVFALSAADGSERWRRSLPTPGQISVGIGPTITVSDGVAYVGSTGGRTFAMGVAEGRTRWTVDLYDQVHLTVGDDGAFGGYYYAPNDTGELDSTGGAAVRFDPDEGRMTWRTTLPREPKIAPGIGDDAAFVATHGSSGEVHALAKADGSQRWHYDPGERDISNPVAADDAVFVGLRV